jgi:HSP20 family protein
MRRRMLERLYGPPLLGELTWAPRADAYEQEGALVITADLPGVKKDDITITISDGVLLIAGERTEEKEAAEAQYYASERFSGRFSRSVALPDGVDTGAITAEQKDGVLAVRVPLPAAKQTAAVQVPITG